MTKYDFKLNLAPRPVYDEPNPLPTALPETASPSNFEVGSGSEVPVPERSKTVLEAASRVADETVERVHKAAEEANEAIHDLRQRFSERLPVWKRQAVDRIDDARFVANRVRIEAAAKAREKPIETIAAAAGAGFLLGATLRIWRSNRG